MTAPAGLLATDNFAEAPLKSMEIVVLAPAESTRLRLAEVYPFLLAKIACCPGAIPVKVHGVTHSGLPSNVICTPAGFDDTVSCASAGAAATACDFIFLPRSPREEAGASEASSGASAAGCGWALELELELYAGAAAACAGGA